MLHSRNWSSNALGDPGARAVGTVEGKFWPKRPPAPHRYGGAVGRETVRFDEADVHVMGEFDFAGIYKAHVMAPCVPQFGGIGFVAAIFRRNGGDNRGDALLFARASNRPPDRARGFSLVGVLDRCLKRAMVT
jgi:hypothetical protein